MNFTLNKTQWKSLGKDLILGLVGLAIAIVYQQLAGTSAGEGTAVYLIVFSLVANYLHRTFGVKIPSQIDATPEPAMEPQKVEEAKV